MVDRSGRDQQIKIRDELALVAKIGADASKALHDGIVEWQQDEAGEETAKARELHRGVRSTDRAFEELTVGDDADRQALTTQLGQQIDGGGNTDESIDQLIGIDQIAHGRVMGRVPSSRPR